jgi:rhodanese-related sulfurtransferase
LIIILILNINNNTNTKGGRSMRVAQFLAAKCGFNEVHNVNGGIHQYAMQIDPSLPTY